MGQRFCEWPEGCSEDISHRHLPARYCAEHQALFRKQEDCRKSYARRHGIVTTEVEPVTRMRQVVCQSCGETFVVPYGKVTPSLCQFCKTDEIMKRAAQASSEESATVKRLGKPRAISGLNCEERARGYYMIDGKLMVARMVV